MKKISLWMTGLLLLLFGSAAMAQTAEELVQKNIEARGGYEAIKGIQTVKMVGKVLTAQGMEFPFTIYSKRPNKMRMESDVQGQKMVQAFDGETGWWIIPFMGINEPQRMPEEQLKQIKTQADFDGPLFDYKEKGSKIEYLGKEDVEGTETYKLKVTQKNGDVRYVYLDGEYYLTIKQVTKRKKKDTEFNIETFLGDFKEVNGVLMPFSIESRINGQTASQVTIEKIEPNAEISDDLFKMPESSADEETEKK